LDLSKLFFWVINNTKVDVLTNVSAYTKITDKSPFGSKNLTKQLVAISIYDDNEREQRAPTFAKTKTKYEEVREIFYDKKKAFLRNAIDYYLRSIDDKRKEEKLLDLTICLESLFSNEIDELGLRYSLRVAFLLATEEKSKRPIYFKSIHDMYSKRSKVVHGQEEVELNDTDLFTFQMSMREAIRRLIHIDMKKQDIIKLLDESVYNVEKEKVLEETVKKSLEKW
jgi:hypothetical protein